MATRLPISLYRSFSSFTTLPGIKCAELPGFALFLQLPLTSIGDRRRKCHTRTSLINCNELCSKGLRSRSQAV